MEIETHSLESMCELVVDCPHSTPAWKDEGLIVLRNQNIRNGRLDLASPSYTDEEHFQKRVKRAEPTAGDLVFTREAPMGEVCIIPEGIKCCLGQRQVLLRPKKSINSRYLLLALQSPFVQHQISWNEGTGSTVSNVKIPILKGLLIPRFGYEDGIAQILGALDDKFELNREMNQTLEAIAQALFKSWFVDFEPVKAKAQARAEGKCEAEVELAAIAALSGKSGLEVEQLPEERRSALAETAGLFSDALVESELGLIPEGWSIQKIGNIAAKVAMGPFGSRITKDNFIESGVPVIRGNNLTNGFNEDEFVFLSNEKADELKSSNVFCRDIIFTHRGTLGQIGFIPDSANHERYVVSQSQMFLRVNQEITSPIMVYRYFLSHVGQFTLLSYASQVGVPAIARPTTSLKSIQLAIPPKSVADAFDCIASVCEAKFTHNTRESQTLGQLRDTLLPKLLSGELTLPEATAQAENALN